MCRLRIAVDRFARAGEERQSDFFNVTCWRQQAEFVSRYFSKGSMIHIEGKLQNNNYTDQNNVKHYTNDVVADNVSFCGGKNESGGNAGGYTAPSQYNNQQYQQPRQAAPQPAAAPQAAVNQAPQPIELGDLGDFEEILSDGEVPF
jgi:single-strand DNA-binding protein